MADEVTALFRVHEKGQIFRTKLDLTGKVGTLVGIDKSMFQLDASYYNVNSHDLAFYSEPPLGTLESFICKRPAALMVALLNNISVIVVTRVGHVQIMLSNDNVVRSEPMDFEPFKFSARDIGLVKTELLTVTCVQPDAHLILNEDTSECLVSTPSGIRWVKSVLPYEDPPENKYSRYQEMVMNPDAYGLCYCNGGTELVKVDSDFIRLL